MHCLCTEFSNTRVCIQQHLTEQNDAFWAFCTFNHVRVAYNEADNVLTTAPGERISDERLHGFLGIQLFLGTDRGAEQD